MKHPLHYLRQIFFFLLITIVISCEKEELSTNQESVGRTHEDFNFTTKSLAITKMNDKDFKEIFEKLHISKKGMESKKVKLDFIIDSSRVVKIERENYTSWTIRIKKRDSSENSIDNLVIEMKGGENQTKAYIINYKPDYSTLAYNEEHGNYNFNSTKTITTIDFDASGLLGAREECFMITILMCDWGGDAHVAGDNCSAPYMYYQNYEECFYVPDGPGGLPVNSNDPDYGGSTITTLSLISEDEFSHVRNYVKSNLTLGPGKFWVMNVSNTSKVCQIYAFLVDNHLSEEAKAFAKEAVNTMVNNPDINTLEEVIFEYLSPEVPINDLEDFLKCYDITKPATITIYSNQASDGNNSPFGKDRVGHSFVSISQNGNTSTFGFYSEGEGVEALSSPSMIGDNGGDEYDVSVSKNVSGNVLSDVLDYAINYPEMYVLAEYNCTDYALNIGSLAGINFDEYSTSYTILDIPLGVNTPGELGENIRELQGLPGLTVNVEGGSAPPRGLGCN